MSSPAPGDEIRFIGLLERADRLLKRQARFLGTSYTLSVVSTAGNTCDVVRVRSTDMDLVVRMPRVPWTSMRIPTEAQVLREARRANISSPRVVMVGQPDEWYPHHWLLLTYIPGSPLTSSAPAAMRATLNAQRALLASIEWSEAPPCARGRA